ncbi:MAG: MATE family efflux transporter [Ignavibacteriales bacterium CG_4_9_14_3_um_filter_34_10]|nr:MAG: MATE family efflux transporter [Ignavibacteriales bacterium CG_4_9_14_3_um_filter_34_10]
MKVFPSKNDFAFIMRIAFPAIAGLSTQMIVSLIDAAMVGRIENAQVALAAMGIGMLATWAIVSFFSSLATGTQVLIAKAYGSKKISDYSLILNSSILLNSLVGIIVALVFFFFSGSIAQFFSADVEVGNQAGQYIFYRFLGLPFFLITVAFRGFYFGIGRTKVFMYSGILVNTLNVGLNYIFIYGEFGLPAMGLAGAAIGSTIATFADVVYYLIVSLSKEIKIKYNLFSNFNFSSYHIKSIIKISVPVSFQNISILIGFLSFISVIGLIGTKEQAASQVVFSSLLISLMPCFGFGIAAQTIFGNNLGAGKIKRGKEYIFDMIRISTLYTFTLAVIFIFIPEMILYIVTDDAGIIATAQPIMKIAGIGQLFYAAGIILANALQASGKSLFVMFSDVLSNWVIFVPLSYLLGVKLGLGFYWAWFALPFYSIFYSSINFYKFYKDFHDTNHNKKIFKEFT